MKRVFGTAECDEVRNSIFWELRYKKHENQMKDCVVELKVSDCMADERVDLVGLWSHSKRSARYGGWPVCSALKVKERDDSVGG